MKILLDENLPVDLRHFLPDHQIESVSSRKWKGLKNGVLLSRAADEGFDVMLSRDAGIEFQQNLKNLPLAVVLLPRNAKKIEDILPLLPSLLTALASIVPKSLTKL